MWFIAGIMFTRGDVLRVLRAFADREWSYWQTHYDEWMLFATYPPIVTSFTHTEEPQVVWDGFRWNYVRQFICATRWSQVKSYVEGMGKTYLREEMKQLIQSVSPRLYRELWND